MLLYLFQILCKYYCEAVYLNMSDHFYLKTSVVYFRAKTSQLCVAIFNIFCQVKTFSILFILWMLTLITLLKNCFPVMIIASSINAIYLEVNHHVLERKVVWNGITHRGKHVYIKIYKSSGHGSACIWSKQYGQCRCSSVTLYSRTVYTMSAAYWEHI